MARIPKDIFESTIELTAETDLQHPEYPEFQITLPESGMPLKEVQYAALLFALKKFNGVQRQAASYLGISPRAMSYKVKCFKINVNQLKST
jgi:DNA-binding NtrC family response regulator